MWFPSSGIKGSKCAATMMGTLSWFRSNGFIRQKTMDTNFVKNHQSLHDCSEIFVQKLIAAMVVV
jgi:hypothetical protein